MIKLYKRISYLILFSLLSQTLLVKSSIAANRVLWPSSMNLFNDTIDFDKLLPETATSSQSKKGFTFISDVKEVFTLGAGNISVNITLSGLGHTFLQLLEGFKKRGIKITAVLCNDKAPVGINLNDAPAEYKNPYFYMIDFSASNGEWQKYNFDRIVDDYGDYVDNWVLGNEINSQMYNYYGPSDIATYTKAYCETFKICYEKIKDKNPNADVYISFDQGWDLPTYRKNTKSFDKVTGLFRYNMKEQLGLINEYLSKDIDWGVALHPYPAPVESAKFWDDEYAGYDDQAKEEKERPYLLTLKNLDLAVNYLAQDHFLKKDKSVRNIIISEFGLTSKDGERVQAAALYYLWEKIKDNPLIKCFIYTSQTDLDDYKFGLTSDKGKKRLIWAVFKDMDRDDENAWCKDLLDAVLDENDYVDFQTFLFPKASFSELSKGN